MLHGLLHYQTVIPNPSVTDVPDPIPEIKLIGMHSVFVSAQAIGNQGERGVWIERVRSGARSDVVAFKAPSHSRGVDKILTDTRLIDGRVVYDIVPYDQRGVLSFCAAIRFSQR